MEHGVAAYKGNEPYVFVSYSHADEALVYPEIQWLHGQGFNVWYDEGISPGSAWSDEIAQSIEGAALFLYFITPRSIERPHCQREVNFAVRREIPLLAVHLEETPMPSGMDLTLSSIQAILRYQITNEAYRAKLLVAANRYLVPGAGSSETAYKQTRPAQTGTYQFGDWLVDVQRNEIRREGETKRLEPKVLDVLRYFLDHAGNMVSTEDLMDAVWMGRAIEPGGVARNIALIRRALGDDSQHPTYIETISKRGYRTVAAVSFAAPVAVSADRAGEPAPASSQHAPLAAPRIGRRSSAFWLVAGAAMFAIGMSIWLYSTSTGDHTLAADVGLAPTRSIAVLPFVNVSADDEHKYLADGLAIELIQSLANVPRLRVASNTVSLYFKDKQVDLSTIGEQINVDYIVEGSVRASEDTVRVTAQLTDVRDGFQIWSRTYDRDFSDLLGLQSELARAIIGGLPLLLEDTEFAAAVEAGTTHPEAYDKYLRASDLIRNLQGRHQLVEAQTLLRSAIELDDRFYAAYEALAQAIGLSARFPGGDITRSSAMGQALALLETIDALDEHQARSDYAHHQESMLFLKLAQFPSVENRSNWEAFTRRQLMAEGPEARWFGTYGLILAASGLATESLAYGEAAEAIEPSALEGKIIVGKSYFHTAQYQRALAKFNDCLTLVPGHGECVGYKGFTLAALGDVDRALALLDESPWRGSSSVRCNFLLYGGRPCNANEHYDENAVANAEIAARTGDYEQAFRWIDLASERGDFVGIGSRTWPNEFLADPRWQAYLDGQGLTDEWRDEVCRRATTLEPYTEIAINCRNH